MRDPFVKFFYLIIFLTVVAIVYIVDAETKFLTIDGLSNHGKPSLVYTRPELHLEYLKHSNLTNNEIYGTSGKYKRCVRPFYKFNINNEGTPEEHTTVTNGGTKCYNANSSMNMTLVNESDLSYRKVNVDQSIAPLQYMKETSDSSAKNILDTYYEIVIKYIDDSDAIINTDIDDPYRTLRFKLKENNESKLITTCNININFNNSNRKNSKSVFENKNRCKNKSSDVLNISINGSNDDEIMRINKNNKLEVAFKKPQDWKLKDINFSSKDKILTVNCPFIGIANNIQAKYFTQMIEYTKTSDKLTISCQKKISKIKTETEKLAAIFALYGNNQKLETTLNKQITNKLDSLIKRSCGNNCDAKVVAMDSSSGEIRSIVSYNQDYGNILNKNNFNQDTIEIDTTKKEIPGSIIKPILSKAILIDSPNIAKLKIMNATAGNIDWSDGRRQHSGQLLNSHICRNEKECNENYKGYSVKNKYEHSNIDFNKFMAQSNNVYATSVMFLSNFHQDENNGTDRKWIKRLIAENGNNQKEINNLLNNPTYFTLAGGTREEKIAPWALNINKIMGVSLSMPRLTKQPKKDETFERYTNYREYVWPQSKGLSKNFLYRASPEREFLDYDYCFRRGFFDCGAYQWIIGGSDSRWSPITLAEQISSIASNNNIQASFVKKNSDPNKPDSAVTKANKTVFQGMQDVVKRTDGTAHKFIKKAFDNLNKEFKDDELTIIAKTGTPNKVSINKTFQRTDSVIFKILNKYFKSIDIGYGSLVSDYDKSTVELNEMGQLILSKIKNTKEFKQECKPNSSCLNSFDNKYKKYIRSRLKATEVGINSNRFNKSLVFTVGKYDSENSLIKDGCTFYISVNFRNKCNEDQCNDDEYKALKIGRDILNTGIAQQCIELK